MLNRKNQTSYYNSIAKIYLKQGDLKQAEIYFVMAINLSHTDDQRGDAHWQRAMFFCDDLHDYYSAAFDFEAAIKYGYKSLTEELDEVKVVIAQLDTVKKVTQQLKTKHLPNRAELLTKRAMGYYHSEQNDKALQDFEEAGKLKPSIVEDVTLGFYWGELAFLLKKYARSIELLNKTRQKHPKDKDVLLCLGHAYLANGNYQEVIEVFDFFVQNCTEVQEYVEVHAYRGKAKFALKDYAGALKDFERYLLYDPYLEPYVTKEMKECKKQLGRK